MSILPMRRLTLIGLSGDKRPVLDQLQGLGCMHLLPLRASRKAAETLPPEHAEDARKALRYLVEVKEKRHQIRHSGHFDMQIAVFAALANQVRLRNVNDHRDLLRQRIRDLAHWGEFELPALDDLYGQRLWFYVVPRGQMAQLQGLNLPWEEVHRDPRASWVVLIAPEEPDPALMPVPRVRTGSRSLGDLRRRLEELELELEDIHAERTALTRWIYLMSSHLAAAENAAALEHAESQVLEGGELFAVQGWVPAERVGAVEALTEGRGLALLVEAPGPEDSPPTLLRNPAPLAAGEDLVGFYQMPAYHAWDPSRVLFFSFALFFAMILSDAGYAALLGLLLAAAWRRLGRSPGGRRARVLAGLLVAGSIAWGVLVGSYFGVAPPAGSLAAGLAVFDLQDFDMMMHLSVGVGVSHLVLASGQKALIKRGSAEGYEALGWLLAMTGGYVYWLGAPGGLGRDMGQAVAIAGLGLVLLLGSERPVTGMTSLALRLLDGLRALTGITKLFGDALSYLRLFALGLASASLALTFNDLARQVHQEVPGPGLLLAILILLVGHLLNLALAVLSGVVHGLRLNFIEFYNWALSGEGYPFRPLKKKELQE